MDECCIRHNIGIDLKNDILVILYDTTTRIQKTKPYENPNDVESLTYANDLQKCLDLIIKNY